MAAEYTEGAPGGNNANACAALLGTDARARDPRAELRYYTIRVRGTLGADWSEWFDGLCVTQAEHGETVLAGFLRDQAALFGVLMRLNALNLPLLAVIAEGAQFSEQCSPGGP
jgi:hypothetical protein